MESFIQTLIDTYYGQYQAYLINLKKGELAFIRICVPPIIERFKTTINSIIERKKAYLVYENDCFAVLIKDKNNLAISKENLDELKHNISSYINGSDDVSDNLNDISDILSSIEDDISRADDNIYNNPIDMAKRGVELLEDAYKQIYNRYPNPGNILGIPNELEKLLKLRMDIKSNTNTKIKSNKGLLWTKEEDNLLIKEYEECTSIKDIASSHKRSEWAIKCRLDKLGLIKI